MYIQPIQNLDLLKAFLFFNTSESKGPFNWKFNIFNTPLRLTVLCISKWFQNSVGCSQRPWSIILFVLGPPITKYRCGIIKRQQNQNMSMRLIPKYDNIYYFQFVNSLNFALPPIESSQKPPVQQESCIFIREVCDCYC